MQAALSVLIPIATSKVISTLEFAGTVPIIIGIGVVISTKECGEVMVTWAFIASVPHSFCTVTLIVADSQLSINSSLSPPLVAIRVAEPGKYDTQGGTEVGVADAQLLRSPRQLVLEPTGITV